MNHASRDGSVTLFEIFHQLRQHIFGFSGNYIIDPGKDSEIFQPHIGFKIGTAKQDFYVGIFFFNPFSQSKAGNVLIKGRGKPYNIIGSPVAGVPGPFKKLGNHFSFYIDQKLSWALNRTADIFNMRFKMVHVILILGVVSKKRMRKQPFADQEAFFTKLVVDR